MTYTPLKRPMSAQEAADNYRAFMGWVEGFEVFNYHRMLLQLATDTVEDGIRYCGFINAPAARNNHHAYVGGLIVHYSEMWTTWLNIQTVLDPNGQLGDKDVLLAIINHDLHKAWKSYKSPPIGDYTQTSMESSDHPTSKLMNYNQKTMYLLNSAGIHVSVLHMNALFTSEGGWASDPPKWQTPLGKLVYLLDEMSSNVYARLQNKHTAMGDHGKGITIPLDERSLRRSDI